MISSDERTYLRLLSIFHFVLGGLVALFSLCPLFHVGFGVAILLGLFDGEPEPPPRFIGGIFIGVGAVFVLLGELLAGLMLYAGLSLAAQKRWLFCVVVAAIECMLMPFGTILGAFTLVVLLRPGVKEGFGVESPSAAPVISPASPAA